MTDFWSFLLQTLTASGAAALLLVMKALFRDKLSPRWQFGLWAILVPVLLLPAGWGGRSVVFPWPLWLETLKTALTGDYGLTRVLAPVPLALRLPTGPADILFDLYVLGVLFFLARYLLAYLRLRLALRRGTPAGSAQTERVAAAYGLRSCPAVRVSGLSSAFVCGVFRPALALPAEGETDDKVVLHELLHLKHQDAAWGLLICFFRCLHWCNPLLWYCADRAGNDAEALCDQRVLERLEGEARRDYGRILLSMAGGRYARAPGTSSMANGGRNIRDRIQAIARFKRYPAGMALVSVCVAVVTALPIVFGSPAQSAALRSSKSRTGFPFYSAMAAARVVRCTTPAGALDVYGKAVLDRNGVYRALSAPLEDHAALAAGMGAEQSWESGLPGDPDLQSGYFIYNLVPDGGGYRALMVFPLRPVYGTGEPPPDTGRLWVGVQTVRTEKRGDRWVVLPLEDFRMVETAQNAGDAGWLALGCRELPAAAYQARTGDFFMELDYQTVYAVDNEVRTETDMSWITGPSLSFSLLPQPHASFASLQENWDIRCAFTGSAEARRDIRQMGFSVVPLNGGGARPALLPPGSGNASGSGADGSSWSSLIVTSDWDGTVSYSGGALTQDPVYPTGYAADIYLNGMLTESLTLLPLEGGAS